MYSETYVQKREGGTRTCCGCFVALVVVEAAVVLLLLLPPPPPLPLLLLHVVVVIYLFLESLGLQFGAGFHEQATGHV